MFTLQDGREHLYQWDLDRYIIVNDANICEVHFCNRTSDCSLVVEVKDGLAAIPNILLQDARPIRAYAYCDDKYTLTESQFTVKSRTRPSDYVYTETEVKRYDSLEERITYLEEHPVSEEVVANSVKQYLEDNPIEIDLSGKADVEHTHTINEIIDYTEPDLSEYAKKEDIPDVSSFIAEIPAEYITESELAGKKYATEGYVDDAIANMDIPDVDVDLSNYYTKQETNSIIAEIESGVEITDDGEGNVTIKEGEGGEITPADLSNYYTKSEVDALIPDNYLDSIPEYYVTETELEAKGYLTEHQSLAAYATKQYVTESLTDVATKDYVNSAVDGANKAVSFSNYSAMVTALNTAAKTEYQIGQNIMIVTLAVPDLWVSNISSTSTPYTYTTDTAITDALKANGVVQVGYFTLSALETQKVDLTDYNTSTEVDTKIADAVAGIAETRVKEDTTININVTSTVPVLNFVYSNPITAINSMNTNRVQGHSFQIKTAASCTVSTTQYWIGDECADGVFTPAANTNYEIYSYYNQVSDKVINMVMNLGA